MSTHGETVWLVWKDKYEPSLVAIYATEQEALDAAETMRVRDNAEMDAHNQESAADESLPPEVREYYRNWKWDAFYEVEPWKVGHNPLVGLDAGTRMMAQVAADALRADG